MFKLDKEQFIKYMDITRLLVFVDDKHYEIIPELKIYGIADSKTPKTEVIVTGYRIRERKWDSLKETLLDNDFNLEHQTRDDILKIINAGEYIDVIMICDYYSLEEYLDAKEFEKASMEYILNKYNDCNKMSLVTLFPKYCNLTETEAKLILDELSEHNLKSIKKLYDINNISENFNLIIKNIKNECSTFKEKHFKEYKKDFENSFICDHVGEDTLYDEPKSFYWHAYHTFGSELDNINFINKHIKKSENNKILKILDKYSKLKNNYISHKITFNTYVTGGPLQIIYYFNLNEETKEYLLQFKDDYSFNNGLEDLALYKDDNLLYASCTHEKFRYHGLSEENKNNR